MFVLKNIQNVKSDEIYYERCLVCKVYLKIYVCFSGEFFMEFFCFYFLPAKRI